MKLKYRHHGQTYELAASTVKLTSPTFPINHNGQIFYVPLISPNDANASKIRIVRNGNVYAPIRYFDEPINMLNGRTLADLKAIFQSGLGKYYFKAGDFFDITFAESVTLQSNGVIDAGSTWRVVCLGIDHNANIEGYNRGHFAIGRNTDNVDIAFANRRMNATSTNAGGWGACEMRTWLNSTFYDALPDDLKAVISPCTKYTDNVGGTDNLPENVTATVDNIWLLGQRETRNSMSSGNPQEGVMCKRYDYYINGNSRVRYNHMSPSTAIRWRLRSPRANHNNFFRVWSETGVMESNQAQFAHGFVPCFTIGGESD